MCSMDASCACTDRQFHKQTLSCLRSQCEEADVESAKTILHSQQCGTSGELFDFWVESLRLLSHELVHTVLVRSP